MDFKQILTELILTAFLFSGCSWSESSIVVIPKNYNGYVLLIFDQKSGEPIEFNGKKRVYRIPSNGILKTQFELDESWHVLPEFYNGTLSKSSQIDFIADPNKVPIDRVVASGGASGSINKDLAGNQRVYFIQYYVGNNDQMNTAYKEVENLDILELIKR